MIRTYTMLFFILFVSISSLAQNIQSNFIQSNHLGKKMSYRVALPLNYSESKVYYPIFLMDGEQLFYSAISSSVISSIHDNSPEALIISIDYSIPNNREEIGFNANSLALTSRGELFQRYITEELIKDVISKYNISANRTILGYSYTASYLLTLMNNHPEAFNNYIMITPEVVSGNVDDYLAKITPNIKNSRFICITAQHDTKNRIRAGKKIYDSFKLTNQDLSQYKMVVNADHTSVLHSAISEAIPLLFRDYINEDRLVKMYSSKKSLKTTSQELFTNSNHLNMLNYGIPLKLNSGNMIFLMDRAIEAENNPDMAKSLLSPFLEEAVKDEELLQVSNIIYYLNSLDQKDKSDSLYRWGITVSDKKNNVMKSFNIRMNYARDILVKQDSSFEKAWEVLDGIVYDISDLYQGIILYFKGEISANYSYNNEQGIAFLESSQEYLKDLSMWGIGEERIYVLIAKCYNNLGNKEKAQSYIQKAKLIAPNMVLPQL